MAPLLLSFGLLLAVCMGHYPRQTLFGEGDEDAAQETKGSGDRIRLPVAERDGGRDGV